MVALVITSGKTTWDYWELHVSRKLEQGLRHYIGRAKRFTQLDLTSAYYRMRIREGDEWKTAFHTRYGPFEYQVIPFNLSNAPTSSQVYINKILAEKLEIFVIVYLENILVYTEDSSQSHLDVVR